MHVCVRTHTLHRDRDSVVLTLLSTQPPPWHLAQCLANTVGVGVGDEAGFANHVGAQHGWKG